ncbi:MAG: phage baseplate assembly protein V [Clostridia bacterium]|nr:phage baseplate assembly protein V [Clostridia bacterium]
MGQTIYTIADIVVEPYEFNRILEFKLVRELNEHAKLSINGIMPEEKMDQYIENSSENETIKISIKNGDKNIDLFYGVVTGMSIHASMNVRSIEIQALSLSFLMDIKKKKRSFQNKNAPYKEIFDQVTAGYPKSEALDEASKGQVTGGLLVQYMETDWEFAKRLASHFNVSLIPSCPVDGVKYYVGEPDSLPSHDLQEFNYIIKKDIKDYLEKSQNGIEGMGGNDLISYEITTRNIFDLVRPINFKNKKLYIMRAVTEVREGIVSNTYTLRDVEGLKCTKGYNHQLTGISLFGKVTEVAKDMVKVHLEIDEKQSNEEAMWFHYSTIYSSPDGSGWYCMPEIGDKVRLYFPDADEKNAFAASAVNLTSSDPKKRSDPSIKSISTKYGKHVVFQKGAIEIMSNGKQLMRLTDDGGIEIRTDKKISITAKEDIEINSGAKILVQGEAGIDLMQATANLIIADDVSMNGAKVNIE